MKNNYYDFIEAVEGYYGKYRSSIVKEHVVGYLNKTIKETNLKALWKMLIESFPNIYNKPPDVKAFRDLLIIDNWNKNVDFSLVEDKHINKIIKTNITDVDQLFAKIKAKFSKPA